MKIKKIVISGFRGFLTPFTIYLYKNDCKSKVIFGRNGTGKSSVTDALEWFYSGKILHLAREGAMEDSYPNKNAEEGQSFVEVEFDDNKYGNIRLEYNSKSKKKPNITGDLDGFRNSVRHPFYIRYEDLTRFVYLEKAKRYDELASLMGFSPQVEYQKYLKKVEKKIIERFENIETEYKRKENELIIHAGIGKFSEEGYLERVNERLKKQGLKPVDKDEDIIISLEELKKKVERDPNAVELTAVTRIIGDLSENKIVTGLYKEVNDYYDSLLAFKDEQFSSSQIKLLDIFIKAEGFFELKKQEGEIIDTCPLCGFAYGPDLLDHIKRELEGLKELKTKKEKIDKDSETLKDRLTDVRDFLEGIIKNESELTNKEYEWAEPPFPELIRKSLKLISDIEGSLQTRPEYIKIEEISSLGSNITPLKEVLTTYEDTSISLLSRLEKKKTDLESDKSRQELVADYDWLRRAIDIKSALKSASIKKGTLSNIYREFSLIAKGFTDDCIATLQKHFDEISQDVEKYFGIIEKNTEGLSAPALVINPDKDRAVELEIGFYGDRLKPAYRYLSESQLSSFGLSVFLASVKRFNQDFLFIILDDIINSLDIYKRPQVIELLKNEFPDHQFLITTHDDMWMQQITDKLPSWLRIRFKRYEYGSGPIADMYTTDFEKIRNAIDDDEPTLAGQVFGPHLEMKLQEVCEAFEAEVKYNRRNEYTLPPLLQSLKSRVKKKLGNDHDLFKAISALEDDSWFRNFSAHWKNPPSGITSQEMANAVSKWDKIVSIVYCRHKDCGNLLFYDGTNSFVCNCRKTKLVKEK